MVTVVVNSYVPPLVMFVDIVSFIVVSVIVNCVVLIGTALITVYVMV